MKVPNQLIGNKNVVSDSSALNEGLIGFRRWYQPASAEWGF